MGEMPAGEADSRPMLEDKELPAKPADSSRDNETPAGIEQTRPLDLRRLLKLAWPERWLLIVATIGLAISSGTGLVVIAVVGSMVDIIVTQDPEGRNLLSTSLLTLIAIFCFGGLMTFVRASLFTIAGERFVKRLRNELFSSIIEFEIAFFDQHRTGEILSRLSDDCSVIQSTVTSNISMGLRNVITVLGCLIIMLTMSWRLTLVMLSVVPVLAIGVVRYGKFVKGISKEVRTDAVPRVASHPRVAGLMGPGCGGHR